MPFPPSRREVLLRSANGFGAAALAAMLADDARAEDRGDKPHGSPDPFAPKKPQFAPKAKSVIVLFMDGGPSQVDTFDPKPALEKYHGKPFPAKVEPTQFNAVGNTLASPWKFKKYGQSGLPVSDLFPHVGACADDLAVIRSMVSNFSEHTNANYFWHSGHGQQGRPSFGSWVTYGLGTESRDLPGFVVLGSGMVPPGGIDCFGNGFLPAAYQGSLFRHGSQPVADITRLLEGFLEQVPPDARWREEKREQGPPLPLDVLRGGLNDHAGFARAHAACCRRTTTASIHANHSTDGDHALTTHDIPNRCSAFSLPVPGARVALH